MSRLRLLPIAVAVALVGAWDVWASSHRLDGWIVRDADGQLSAVQPEVAARIAEQNARGLALAKTVSLAAEIVAGLDETGKPTPAALEASLGALGKAMGAAAAENDKPDLVVLLGGGSAVRYRAGASNRFDSEATAYEFLGPASEPPHALVGTLEGQPYRLAVAPLARGPLRGLVALGWALDEAAAKQLAKSLGVDVTLLIDRRVVGSTLQAVEYAGANSAFKGGEQSAGFGSLHGEAFALIEMLPLPQLPELPFGLRAYACRGHLLQLGLPGVEAGVLLSVSTADRYAQLAQDQRLKLGVFSGLLALCLLLAVAGRTSTRGLARLVQAAEKLARGDLTVRAPTDRLAQGLRPLAQALNTLADQANAGVARAPSMSDLLQRPAPSMAPAAPATDGEPPETSGEGPSAGPPPPPADAGWAGQSEGETRPSARIPTAMFEAFPPAGAGAGLSGEETVVAPLAESLLQAAARPATGTFAAVRPLPPVPAPVSEEGHFQTVFREFVATRERCGEGADGLTYDKFAAKLRKNQEQLLVKYNCKSVRFQVYVKEGKAALKATPIKD